MSSLRRSDGHRSKGADAGQFRNGGAPAPDREVVPEMSVCSKLMLSAQLWSTEATCNFEQLYTMPMLQMLGVPLRLLALTGLVAGPSSMLLLPLVGWVTDRGSNPFRRKALALAFASGLVLMGMLVLIVANLMHLSESETSGGAQNVTVLAAEAKATSFEMPVQGALGLLGFVVLDVGFDGICSFTKAFVLTCSPRDQHTSILVLGLVMASAGGVSTAALGVVDFTSLLGLEYIDGGSLSVRLIVTMVIILLGSAIGLSCTFFTGLAQFRENLKRRVQDDMKQTGREASHDSPSQEEEEGRKERRVGAGDGVNQQAESAKGSRPMTYYRKRLGL